MQVLWKRQAVAKQLCRSSLPSRLEATRETLAVSLVSQRCVKMSSITTLFSDAGSYRLWMHAYMCPSIQWSW
jgi:hypothetical protein